MKRCIFVTACLCLSLLVAAIDYQNMLNVPLIFPAIIFGVVGSVFNMIPILANNYMMPVKDVTTTNSNRHCIMTDETRHSWLADRFCVGRICFSIGDVLLSLMYVTMLIQLYILL